MRLWKRVTALLLTMSLLVGTLPMIVLHADNDNDVSDELDAQSTATAIPDGWSSVPVSETENSQHLAYKIENGVLTFHDFGDPEAEDYGTMPNYVNAADAATRYEITQWYRERNAITTVVFDETISCIGSYTLTNMNAISEIHINNANAVVSGNLALFSTTARETPLSIYAASTIQTSDSWIRGNNYRKLSEAISDATLYYTDPEVCVPEMKALEDALSADGKADPISLYNALLLAEKMPRNAYSVSDYNCALPGAEDILALLWELSFGSCGENLTYQLTAMEEEGKLNLTISGVGAMESYADPDQTPWSSVADCISDVTIGDTVTDIPAGILPANAVYHVYLNSNAYTFARENDCTIQIDTLRVLCIGNSHTADYSEFLTNILTDLENAGMETQIVVSRSGISSIGLYSGRNSNVDATYRSHLEAIDNQSGAYDRLKNNRYDLVVVQDYMESVVDDPTTFARGLATFISRVKTIAAQNGHGEPEIAWFADWVDIRTTGGDNALYDGEGNKIKLDVLDREQVYEKSLASIAQIEKAIADRTPDMPDFVIHASTIKQNAMSSYLGSTKIRENAPYCLLERDTTHMTYELGRYLMGVGVLSEIVTHYSDILALGEKGADVGEALTVENGPAAIGKGNQYEGSVNEEILAIIREAIGSPDSFHQSAYVIDPVETIVAQLSQIEWDMNGAVDRESALELAVKQIDAVLGEYAATCTVEMEAYVSVNRFAFSVRICHGYSIREIKITIHDSQSVVGLLGDANRDGSVTMRDAALLQQYLNGWEVELDLTVADVDGDGAISMRDAVLIQQYLNGRGVGLK